MEAVLSHGLERRAHERIDFSGEVEVEHAGETHEALSTDIAAGGMRVVFGDTAPVKVGDEITTRFRLPALDSTSEATAIVRWVGGPGNAAAGLQFNQGLRAREVWALNQLQLARR
jgi:c-di-GMP-binding flagellar brake protein YcgR